MATEKEVLIERQKALLDKIDFHKRMMDILPVKMQEEALKKIDALFDEYNDLQKQIEKL